jgi:hypothetical protein
MIGPLSVDSPCDRLDWAGASWHDVLPRHCFYDDAIALRTPVRTITCHGLFIHMSCWTRLSRDVAAPTYGEMT